MQNYNIQLIPSSISSTDGGANILFILYDITHVSVLEVNSVLPQVLSLSIFNISSILSMCWINRKRVVIQSWADEGILSYDQCFKINWLSLVYFKVNRILGKQKQEISFSQLFYWWKRRGQDSTCPHMGTHMHTHSHTEPCRGHGQKLCRMGTRRRGGFGDIEWDSSLDPTQGFND